MTLLAVEGLTVRYGAIAALRDVSLDVRGGETVALVGPNGAGKSTLTLAIAGAVRPAAGRIAFDGSALAGLAPEAVARRGIALVPEGRHIFEGLTVLENLRLGITLRRDRAEGERDVGAMLERFPILGERRHGVATRLSGGEQQQLAIARALLSRPRLLILDEPSLGLAPLMIDRVYEILAALKAEGVTILLVEQNPARVGDVADRVVLLASGSVRGAGRTADLLGASLDEAYLGVGSAAG